MKYTTFDGTQLDDERLEARAAQYEAGTWEGHGEVVMGRPKLCDEDMETVSFRLPRSRIDAVEAVAKRQHCS